MAYALILGVVLLTVASVTGEEYQHAWSYADMTEGCKPVLSVPVKFESSRFEMQKISLKLSTSSMINRRMLIHTSEWDFSAKHRAPCLYRGTNAKTGNSVFASEIDGHLKMTFKLNGSWYQAEKYSASPFDDPASARKLETHEDEAANMCEYEVAPRNFSELNARGASSSLSRSAFVLESGALNVESFQGSVADKMLELVVVLESSFISKAGGESSAVARLMQIANFVNGLYQPLRLRVVLTEVILWRKNEILIEDHETTLRRFTIYKAFKMREIRHDSAMLLSAKDWGKNLGLAWMRSACHTVHSCGIVSDRYPEEISTALVLTHEIGHNLGFKHMQDFSKCVCERSSTGCVMNSFLAPETRTEALNWSSCSFNSWKSQINETWRSCLKDAPDLSYTISTNASVCGNGILEDGEQCDCGPTLLCSSKCCDARTCRLKSGAACASGSCCDWNTCQLKPRGHVCRPADGTCDVPETCSGSGEWCPSDDKVADGVDCAAGQAFCYNGQCRTRETQCKRLFSSSAKNGDSQCFTSLNVNASAFGHCRSQVAALYITYRFEIYWRIAYWACEPMHAECGLQHCSLDAKPSAGYNKTVGKSVCYSLPHIDLHSSGLRSPSLVPDGAKCGTDSMCVNSSCTPLSVVRECESCPDCHGNGVLTTGKACFCKPGFDPPNCLAEGCGGSVTSPLACPVSSTSSTTTTTTKPTTTTTTTKTTKEPITPTSPTKSNSSTTRPNLKTTSPRIIDERHEPGRDAMGHHLAVPQYVFACVLLALAIGF